MSSPFEPKVFESEIIRQKKKFIFNVEQSSNYVFPNEEYTYLVYIKNISGNTINNFVIQIEAPNGVYIEQVKNKLDKPITLENGRSELYEFKSSIDFKGKFNVHFIGYGEGTQIAHKNLEITCSRSYNSDKLIHRIHIYDFTPYENNFSMEASDYSEEVTQIFKRQKLPYKAGEQPFKLIKPDNIENIESESYLNQYKEAKNTKEHVYQYISRENFTENSQEHYEGENLYDLINQINTESKYFRAKFLKTGTNTLLNDFTQYKPNGFIYRMGLLSSEIYQYLGVIPTYSYMSDQLFRWAPSPSGQHLFMYEEAEYDLINLYPQPKPMNWDENIWAGKGWIVYKKPTDEYKQTEEFKIKYKDRLIELREEIGAFEYKKDAEKFIEESEYFDEVERNQIQSSLIKYEYELEESLYENGVFFVNIPINNIPKNFYLIDTEELYNIIDRAKPYGVKPIINYIVEQNFDLDFNYKLIPNYIKGFEYDLGDIDTKYRICENKFIQESVICDDQEYNIIKKRPTRCVLYHNDFVLNPTLNIDYSKVGISFEKPDDFTDLNIEEETTQYRGKADQDFRSFKDIFDLLYNNNYNNISFKVQSKGFDKIPQDNERVFINVDEEIYIDPSRSIDAIKLPIYTKYSSDSIDEESVLYIEDSFNRTHKITAKYNQTEELYHIKYIYQNSKGKEYVRKEGAQDINGLIISLANYNNRKILIFMVEDTYNQIHYFYHTIVEDVIRFNTNSKNSLMYKVSLTEEKIILETPFCYNIDEYSPILDGGENWTNLYRLNDDSKTYSYIQNTQQGSITPDSITLHFDEINVPKTALIKNVFLQLSGNSQQNVYVDKSIGEHYAVPSIDGYSLNLKPKSISHYSQNKESNYYYQFKLDQAKSKNQETLIKYYNNLITQNQLFDESVDISISDYMNEYNDYAIISKGFWNELSDFTDFTYNLNEIDNISFVIEGFNEGNEVELLTQTVFETDKGSVVRTNVPEGYFFLEIPLLYLNDFLLNMLKIRFRFYGLNHNIKIFNTTMDIHFKNKQSKELYFEFVEENKLSNDMQIKILENYLYPQDINNGITIKLSFDDINPGEFYNLNSAKLSVIYQDTDIDLMINKDKYRYIPIGTPQTTISGIESNAYLSGEFYNDVCSISQLKTNVGIKNKGIELEDAIYQSFEAREDNITSIELFPYGFIGNPDELLKIGIYTNHGNTPDKLIKEIYANGWTKNNEELKKLPSIKYNLNIDNLTINETYWIKIQVLNPRENSYYLLKSINQTQPRHKLLYKKNNNYINTFSSLTFNIYSKNVSKSFGSLPAIQEFFDNPYILIGLHRGQGTITDLVINKWESTIEEDNHMKEYFKGDAEIILSKTDDDEIGITITNNDGTELEANFEKNKWDVKHD